MGEWHRKLIADTRALQGLPPTIADDPIGVEMAAKFLAEAQERRERLASATPIDSSAPRRGAVE